MSHLLSWIALSILVVLSIAQKLSQRSRPHAFGYLIGTLIIVSVIWAIARYIFGYYMNALGPG